jgi:hypothetical protein
MLWILEAIWVSFFKFTFFTPTPYYEPPAREGPLVRIDLFCDPEDII